MITDAMHTLRCSDAGRIEGIKLPKREGLCRVMFMGNNVLFKQVVVRLINIFPAWETDAESKGTLSWTAHLRNISFYQYMLV